MIKSAIIQQRGHRQPPLENEFKHDLYRIVRLEYEGAWKVTIEFLEEACSGDDTLSISSIAKQSLSADLMKEICVEYLRMRGYNLQPPKTE